MGLKKPVEKESAHGMLFCVAVSAVGCDDMANPAERAARANPKAGREDEPQDAGQDPPVVELADAGNQ